MRKFVIAALIPLSGCAVPMVCGPTSQEGYQRCDPIGYAQPTRVTYSYVPDPGPGYAPPYPQYPQYHHRRHVWVTDEPHWNPGDE